MKLYSAAFIAILVAMLWAAAVSHEVTKQDCAETPAHCQIGS